MKNLILTFFLTLVLTAITNAQSDQLLVKLKSGATDSILISKIARITFENISSIDDNTEQNIQQTARNYPNPFENITFIEFNLSRQSSVQLIIYNSAGNQVFNTSINNCTSGINIYQWNCIDNEHRKLPSGKYFYEILFENEIIRKSMFMIK